MGELAKNVSSDVALHFYFIAIEDADTSVFYVNSAKKYKGLKFYFKFMIFQLHHYCIFNIYLYSLLIPFDKTHCTSYAYSSIFHEHFTKNRLDGIFELLTTILYSPLKVLEVDLTR